MSENIDRVFRRTGIYARRFQIWYPWSMTWWWWPWPLLDRGSNEWCDESVVLKLPLLGALVIFWRPGKLRTMPCPDEWELLDDIARADYAPCGYLYDGRLHNDGHMHWESGMCVTAQRWLDDERNVSHAL